MSTKLKDAASIERIIDEMTLEEKALLITGGTPFSTMAMEKYGIPSAVLLDGATGMNIQQVVVDREFKNLSSAAEAAGVPIDREQLGAMDALLVGAKKAIEKQQEATKAGVKTQAPDLGCYPPGMFLGSTWNPDAVEKCGEALGKEMGSKHVDVILGPNVNIIRDPLAGRAFEGYSEDPYLIGKMGTAMIRGIQSTGVAADAKHFAANSQETNRMRIDEKIPERALQEIYLPGFKVCVQEGQVKTVMSAYNKVGGKECAMNHRLLTDILRKEWGFDGFVVSDWAAAYDQVEAATAGNDLVMPGPRGIKCILEAVENGKLSVEAIDSCVRNFLKVLIELPAFTGQYPSFEMEEAIQATENAAKEGIVLLKNDGVLPLEADSKVVFYGKRSRKFAASGAGSAGVLTGRILNPVDALGKLIGEKNVCENDPAADTNIWIVTVGADGQEGADRQTMDMDKDDAQALDKAITEAKAVGGKVIVILNTAGPISLKPYIDHVDAVICAFYPGMMGGKVLADVMTGVVNPSGKLPLTWPQEYHDCPTYRNFPGEGMEVWYGEGIYVGYRYYDIKQIKPMFAFGYGLSYTSFEITKVEMPETVDVDKEDINICVHVKNTGSMDGSEVVQVYVRDLISNVERPDKELKGFAKLFIKAGEEATAKISISKEQLACYSTVLGKWVTEPGAFELCIGNSSDNILVTKTVNVKCENPFAVTENTSVGAIAANKEAIEIVNSILHINFIDVVSMAIVFFPSMTFKEVWRMMLAPGVREAGYSAEVTEQIYQKILEAFKTL